MSSWLENINTYISDAQKYIDAEEIDKKALGRVLTKLKSEYGDLVENHNKIVKESKGRKDTISELNSTIDELKADQEKGGQSVSELTKQVEELKVQIAEKDTLVKSYDDDLKNDFIAKAKRYKLADNDKFKEVYRGLDNLEEISPDDVKYNRQRLLEHEKLNLFEHVKPDSSPPNYTPPSDNDAWTERFKTKKG